MSKHPKQPIQATLLQQQPMSVTRQMAAAFPRLTAMAAAKGLKLHHLGAGYPHPEVSDPSSYIAHKNAYFRHLAKNKSPENTDEALALRDVLQDVYSYTDTLGPQEPRNAFATVYGNDFGVTMDPELLIPTIGSTGGIAHMCSLYERSGQKIAYITDAPTYAGFLSRASLYQQAAIYSVDMDAEGPYPEQLKQQIKNARNDGYFVAFYYTVPDGHNPGGISFSQQRREAIMDIVREEGILIVEDAPYTYISYEEAEIRPQPFIAIDPEYTVHLFTASKIALPGPRVGFIYTEGKVTISNQQQVLLQQLLLTEASADTLLHNPEALRGFEAFLMDDNFKLRDSLWPIAAEKNAIYGENRQIMLDGFDEYLGNYPEFFEWTIPGAGFFSVFTFKHPNIQTNQDFVEKLVAEYGVVTIPTFGFYPEDAKARNSKAGMDQLRLSFCFSERRGEGRREDLREAVKAFCNAVRIESGLSGIS